jgi:putative GTP pyrophosphokinase
MARTRAFHPEKNLKSAYANTDHDRLWTERPEMIKRFIDQRPDYEKLCAEVAYILNRELSNNEIEFSTITYRAKTLNSFLEKIQRKNYQDPIAEITDFAGVRVVCLYVDDLHKLENIVTENFEVVGKVDKLTNRKSDQFGYGAIHFHVRLGRNFSGARYDDLKDLVCEIQTRTVLQDAWAIIDHHLVYKNESSIPTILRSRLNSLAKNFETVDDEFKNIRSEREDYLRDIERSETNSEAFLENELNLDSFVRYAKWKFPDLPTGTAVLDVPFFLKPLTDMDLRSLSDLDSVVDSGSKAYEFYLAANGHDFLSSYSITSVALSALLINREYTPEHIKSVFPKYIEFIANNTFDKMT